MNTNHWNDLEEFSQTRTRVTGPYITINNGRLITLSAGFIRHAKDQIAGNTHVILSFSKQNNAIVFKFIANADSPGAIKMSIRDKNGNIGNDNNGTNASLAAKSFLQHYQVDITKYVGRYKAKLENIPGRGEFWVVYLNEKCPSTIEKDN